MGHRFEKQTNGFLHVIGKCLVRKPFVCISNLWTVKWSSVLGNLKKAIFGSESPKSISNYKIMYDSKTKFHKLWCSGKFGRIEDMLSETGLEVGRINWNATRNRWTWRNIRFWKREGASAVRPVLRYRRFRVRPNLGCPVLGRDSPHHRWSHATIWGWEIHRPVFLFITNFKRLKF